MSAFGDMDGMSAFGDTEIAGDEPTAATVATVPSESSTLSPTWGWGATGTSAFTRLVYLRFGFSGVISCVSDVAWEDTFSASDMTLGVSELDLNWDKVNYR